MTMYAKLSDGQISKFPYGSADLRKDFPQTSFPESMADVDLEGYNVVEIQETERPNADSTAYDINGTTAALVDDVWQQQWTVTELPAEQASANVRAQRNQRLAETDWTQLSDSTNAAAWTDYRQALRDVPSQTGFPYEITWPTPPS